MEVTVVRAKELFDPEDELAFIRVGDVYIVEKLDYARILEKIGRRFKDLSEKERKNSFRG